MILVCGREGTVRRKSRCKEPQEAGSRAVFPDIRRAPSVPSQQEHVGLRCAEAALRRRLIREPRQEVIAAWAREAAGDVEGRGRTED